MHTPLSQPVQHSTRCIHMFHTDMTRPQKPHLLGLFLSVGLLCIALILLQPTREFMRSSALVTITRPPLTAEDVAIITAVTGGIDQQQLQPSADIFVYDETIEPLPFPRHDVNERLRSKYFKMNTHWEHPEFSAYIWIDGAYTVHPVELRKWMIEQLGSADCAFFKHPERQTIVQESDVITEAVALGMPYLVVRYSGEPMKAQVDSYVAEGLPVDKFFLLNGGLFIRRNLPHVNAAFDHWFIENFKWTIQDQLSLPYILWKHNVTWRVLEGSIWSGPYHSYRGHT